MKRHHHLTFATGLLLLLAGCADDGADGDEPAGRETTAPPHGYVEGAEETAEQQSRLVVADAATGAVRVIDLITEEVTELGTVDGAEAIGGDGRFAYLTTGDGSLRVIDGGSWSVDHGDHVHYYRAGTRAVGTLDGGDREPPVSVHGDAAVTAVNHGDGMVSLLDREAIEAGTVPAARTVDAEGPAVPYAGHLVTPRAVLTRGGERVTAIDEPCPSPRGEAVTSHGVVFGCTDGALLVSEDGEAFTGTKIPYPDGTASGRRAQEFSQRPGSGTLAAPAGDRGVWTLDAAAERWTLTATGPVPVAAANAVGDGATLLTLTEDGVLHAFDTTTGDETARTELPETGEGAAIQLDTSRAYVNSPSSGVIYEIDYNDELRIARTLTLDVTPSLMLETGR